MTGLIEARASTIAISSTVASSLPVITSRVTASGSRSSIDVTAVIFFLVLIGSSWRWAHCNCPRMAAKPVPTRMHLDKKVLGCTQHFRIGVTLRNMRVDQITKIPSTASSEFRLRSLGGVRRWSCSKVFPKSVC